MAPRSESHRRAMAAWLFACCALVFAIVVVGGITRLTHSGLSIVEWQPLVGTIPPLNDQQWQETFARYQQTPEFRLRNFDMTLAGFKRIFWWEYFHRLLGRVIGVAFLVPFVWVLARGAISRPIAWRLAGIFALGAFQGALGWFMVKSGLVDDPRVSSIRLGAHLCTALLIYASMLWLALGLAFGMERREGPRTRRHAGVLVALVFVMIFTGALVAGIHAGYAYNTYPLMNGYWVPPEILELDPLWKNFVYNMATVQFDHRVLALVVAATAIALAWRVLRDPASTPRDKAWSWALLAAVALQLTLGISTLLLRVPIDLAASHQAGAVVVFTCALVLAHALTRARRLHP
jgi:cytochrome c oxidase assembly protein subunit 15